MRAFASHDRLTLSMRAASFGVSRTMGARGGFCGAAPPPRVVGLDIWRCSLVGVGPGANVRPSTATWDALKSTSHRQLLLARLGVLTMPRPQTSQAPIQPRSAGFRAGRAHLTPKIRFED